MSDNVEIEQLPIINVHTNLRSVLHDSIVPITCSSLALFDFSAFY